MELSVSLHLQLFRGAVWNSLLVPPDFISGPHGHYPMLRR